MMKESISQKQAVSVVTLFVIGSTLVMGISKHSGKDAWMGFIIAMIAVLPVIYIYARLMQRCPGQDIYDICMTLFGPVFGRIVIVLFTWYAFHLGALVMRNFSEFIEVTTFDQMPQTVSLLCMAALVIWICRAGLESLGRWSTVALPVLIIVVLFTVLLLIKDMKINNLLPVGEGVNEVPKDALNMFAYPFAETVLFLGVLNNLKERGRPGRALVYGVLISGFVILFGGFFRNLLTLGPLALKINYPSYAAVGVVIAGGFLSRIEGLISANLLITGFVKISICLLVASKGVAKLVSAGDYRPFTAPLGLLMVALASIVYRNSMEMFEFIDVYMVYALPFQVLIPLALCIVAEIRFLVKEKRERGGASPAKGS